MNFISTTIATAAQTALVAALILIPAYLLRCLISLWRRIAPGAPYSVIVDSTTANNDSLRSHPERPSTGDDFVGLLRAYIAEDIQYVWTLVPGAPRLATPAIPAESPKSTIDWLTSLRSIIAVPARAYHIVVTELESSSIRVAVQVVKNPSDRVIAAATFEAPSMDELVTKVGGYCVEQVQQQRRVLHRTPRWEQWANRGGYTLFRQALLLERQGDRDKALVKYCSAGSLSLGNVPIALRRAGILEQQNRLVEAIQVYHYTQKLWPESIESIYRYAAACSNLRDPTLQSYSEAKRALQSIRRKLALSELAKQWIRTWLPNRRNSGERKYWTSWLQPWRAEHVSLWTRRNKRRDFICAINIADHVVEIVKSAQALRSPGSDHSEKSADISAPDRLRKVEHFLNRKRIGWLAHYNGACFYSLCSQLDPQIFSSDMEKIDWGEKYIGLALGELGTILRDPYNELDPAWVLTDPDMESLRASATANHWASFLGIKLGEMESTMGTREYKRGDPIR